MNHPSLYDAVVHGLNVAAGMILIVGGLAFILIVPATLILNAAKGKKIR